TLLALLPDVLPVIPERGSVGASGDLAPLAHLALALIGEADAVRGDEALSGGAVLAAAGATPLELQAKEGLALLNGTQLSAALELEVNSASDNPLVFEGDVLSGGNFHAEPLAFIADFMAIAMAEVGSIAERRIDLLLRQVNPRLKMFLTATPGLESGYMIAHV